MLPAEGAEGTTKWPVCRLARLVYAARVADSGFRLGIDFGTSNTVAVLRWPDGRTKALLFDGAPILPSAVYVAEDGGILTGRDAVHSARLHPHRFEPYPKRRIDEQTVYLGDREIRSTELIATVLRRVVTEAQRVANTTPAHVTLTHPAAWGAQRRDALSRAAAEGGLPSPMLVAEPVAAASYFVGTVGTHLPIGGSAVVYDFGAGTFDATVVRRTAAGGFDVLSTEGLTDAGGLDVDAAIVTYLGQELAGRAPDEWRRLSQPSDDTDRRAAWQLWEDARQAKETLSRAATTYVHVPLVDDSVPLGREQLERLARPILDRTVTAALLAVAGAGLTPAQLSAVFLVGGSSRIPLAATLLHRGFGTAPTAIEQPELVVADGALQLAPRSGRAVVGPPAAGPGFAGPGAAGPIVSGPGIGGPGVGAAAAPVGDPGAAQGPYGPVPTGPGQRPPGSPASLGTGGPSSTSPAGGPGTPGQPPMPGGTLGQTPGMSGHQVPPTYGLPGTAPQPPMADPGRPVSAAPASGPPASGVPASGVPASGPPVSGPPAGPPVFGPPAGPRPPAGPYPPPSAPGPYAAGGQFLTPPPAGQQPAPGPYTPPPQPGRPAPPPGSAVPPPTPPGAGFPAPTPPGAGFPAPGAQPLPPAAPGPYGSPAVPPTPFSGPPAHPPAQPWHPVASGPPAASSGPPMSGGPYASAMGPLPAVPGPRQRSRGPLVAAVAAGVVVLLLAIGGIAFALSGDNGKGGGGDPPPVSAACGYKLAFLGILSGDNSGDGQTVRNATRLALDKYNRQHDGCTTELVEYDTKGEDDQAGRLAEELARDEKVLGVIGPLWFSEAQKAMPILEAAGVPVVSPSVTYTSASQRGWRTFHRTVGNDADQAAAAARYMTQTMRAQRVFVVADTDEYASAVADDVRRGLNTAFAGRADISGSETTFAGVVSQISSSTADAVYFAGYYDAGGILVKELRAAKPGIKVATWDRLFTDLFAEAAGEAAAEGVVITCPCMPPSEARNNFANEYEARYSEAGYYGPESYDAANVLLAALGAGKATRADVLSFVKAYDGQGVSRRIKFTASGDLEPSTPTVWAYQVKQGGVYKDQLIA
jgi:ABC-type branched-subunit amino acid transport system substrate-binding protein